MNNNRGLISYSIIQLFGTLITGRLKERSLNGDSTVLLSLVRGILGLKTYRQFYTR